MIQPGGRVVCSRLYLKMLVQAAYRYEWAQIENRGEAWIEEGEGWTIEAKIPADAGIKNLRYGNYDIEDPRIRQMLQALLIERFQLKVSREARVGDVYELRRTDRPFKLSVWDGNAAEASVYPADVGWAGTWTLMR